MNTPAKTSGRTWWQGAAIGGALLVAGLAIGTSLYARFWRAQSLQVQDADRELLVTMRDFDPWLKRFTLRTDAESTRKLLHPDGRVELTYEYLHPDPDRELHLLCLVELHPTRKSARESYATLAGREFPAAPFAGLKFDPREDALAWAEAARLGALSQNGQPRGNFFLCRQEERVFCIEVFGVYLENEEHFQDLAFGRFNALESYAR